MPPIRLTANLKDKHCRTQRSKQLVPKPEPPRCFVSYTWDSPHHKEWVRELATQLRTKGVDVVLDQWDLRYGDDLPHFMETAVRESDFVILVCTPEYAKKANQGRGGAGYEKRIVTGEMFQKTNQSKFIPLVRKGSNEEALPTFLQSKDYVDFRQDSEFQEKIADLLHQLHGVPKHPRPRLGPSPFNPAEQIRPSDSRKRAATATLTGLPPHLTEAFTLPHREEQSRAQVQAEWDIEENFDLEGGEYHKIPVKLKAGDRLVGFVKADGRVSAYLLGTSSLRSFDDNLDFSYEWGKEDPITYANVSHAATEARTRHMVVSNGYEDEDGEDFDPVSVEVRLPIVSR